AREAWRACAVGLADAGAAGGGVAGGGVVAARGKYRRPFPVACGPLEEPLTPAVRVDDVDLRIVECGVEAREGDLAIRAAGARGRRNRCHGGKPNGEQHNRTDPPAKEESHVSSFSPRGHGRGKAGLPP